LQRQLLAPLLRRAHRVVSIARFERRMLVEETGLHPDRVVLIPNGSDLPVVDAAMPAPTAPVIASVGRLERFKGHHRVIRALPELLRRWPEAELLVVGEGPYEPRLRALARDLGVAASVRFAAFSSTEREAFARTLAGVSLVTLMSEYETHPLAAIEAAALGKPVLVSDVAGLAAFAADGLGTAVPLETGPVELATAMGRLLEAPPQPPPVRLPTWDECADALLRVYEDADATSARVGVGR
jgi:glycosyltransferase involved in cell wall biosynthesis